MNASDRLEEYVSQLRVRKKWALRYTIMLGVILVLSVAVSLGMAWAFGYGQASPLFTLYVAMLVMGPLFGLVIQATEYRRLNETLDLVDVLRLAMRRGLPDFDFGEIDGVMEE